MTMPTFGGGPALLLAALVALGPRASESTGVPPEGDKWGVAAASRPAPGCLVLVTLDTTRADYLGSYGARGANTTVLDALAERGTRYARALTPSPLTLPAHASLMTGLDPPEHGVLDNGTSVLTAAVPTLATALQARGYATGAFVSSRVLDRRFGLDRGFDRYDDRMAAEHLGEYGYPERDAAAVTSAAIAWLSHLPPAQRYFLWVHYYDPHAPYQPPERWRRASAEDNYAGEIAYMDHQIGRLLSALPEPRGRPLIAVVGDHGEALGEHGERAHGIFLYRSSLEVPLILSGSGIPAEQVVAEAVAIRRLAPTLLRLLGAGEAARDLGASLPGLPSLGRQSPPEPIYSETRMPASAYGWAPLVALSDQRWRLIMAPRPELYDYLADPGETRNLIAERREVTERLRSALAAHEAGMKRREPSPPTLDPELAQALRSLGYLSGSSPGDGTIDPKDGVALLAELERAKGWMQSGEISLALATLEKLAARNPRNIPFLTHLANAQLASGKAEAALTTYRQAIELNPKLDFLHLHLAEAYRQLQRPEEARREYQRVLELNARSATAWLGLAEQAARSKQAAEERRLLQAAVDAGTASAAIHSRLGQLLAAGDDPAAADTHFRQATELTPGWPLPWLLWGKLAETRGRRREAAERYRRAAAVAPNTAEGREAWRRLQNLR
ncbi:MAG: sulfatase-like hydrolase/transferase [bacterium]|nr:sulfatase-like hydrolase/transferase [bacterium]